MICQMQMCVPPNGFIEKMCYLCIVFSQINRDLYEKYTDNHGDIILDLMRHHISRNKIQAPDRRPKEKSGCLQCAYR